LFDEAVSGSYFTAMRSVGLKILKNKLSEYIRLAAGGEIVLVTDRHRVVAEIVPQQPDRKPVSENEFIARGAREGWLTPAKDPSNGPLPRKPVVTFDELMKELDEDRADRGLP
jgi:antitoxin (DNA-binding transcriptional repressor) of toxin-antitoxin stability system